MHVDGQHLQVIEGVEPLLVRRRLRVSGRPVEPHHLLAVGTTEREGDIRQGRIGAVLQAIPVDVLPHVITHRHLRQRGVGIRHRDGSDGAFGDRHGRAVVRRQGVPRRLAALLNHRARVPHRDRRGGPGRSRLHQCGPGDILTSFGRARVGEIETRRRDDSRGRHNDLVNLEGSGHGVIGVGGRHVYRGALGDGEGGRGTAGGLPVDRQGRCQSSSGNGGIALGDGAGGARRNIGDVLRCPVLQVDTTGDALARSVANHLATGVDTLVVEGEGRRRRGLGVTRHVLGDLETAALEHVVVGHGHCLRRGCNGHRVR